MKREKIIACVLAFVSLALVASTPASGQKKGVDSYGGLIDKPAKGVIVFYDYQDKIVGRDMLGFFLVKNGIFRFNFQHKKVAGKFDIAKASEAKGDANLAIFVVDDPTLPMTLLALEEKWGIVNVAQISADKPKTLKLLYRAEKLFTRVGTGLLGGHYCLQIPFSAMKPVYSVADLDKMDAKAIAPLSLTQITYSLPSLGLTQTTQTTYEQACVEGWAPAPTNDVQREIWNDVKNPANRFKKDLPELKE